VIKVQFPIVSIIAFPPTNLKENLPYHRFTKVLGAPFSVQSIPVFPPKQFSEMVPRACKDDKSALRLIF